jgi:peptidoglycan/xylan/chitin deacetylase (PgdA/CDA1 family)
VTASPSWASAALRAARGKRPSFVLCYHGLGHGAGDGDHGLLIPVGLFNRHLDIVAAQGYRTVHLSELWDLMEADPGRQGVGALTIDDGLAASTSKMAEILLRRGQTATVYIATGLMGKPHPDLSSGERIVDRSELLELAQVGLEIGAHTVDHPDLRTLSQSEKIDQLTRSKQTLEDILGRPVTSMAYPFGAVDAATVDAARQAGYRTACACSGPGPWRALEVPREPVYPSTSPFRLRLKVAGLYGPGHAAARIRNRLR